MKKVIYSLAMVLMGLASCTSFDDPTTENYGAGPAIDVNIATGLQTDSAFTVSITPAAGTVYYAYIIDQNDEPEEIDGYTLLKGGYGNTVVNVADYPSVTIKIDDAEPNTTYQVYAVAANDKGVIGDVVVKSIKTTDKFVPTPRSISKDADNAAVTVAYSESIVRGEGAVTAKYYQEWGDPTAPIDVPAEDITVEVSGKSATFSAANIPGGAYLCFSYEAGAFKDRMGNSCAALNSGLNMNTGQFSNIWVHVTTEKFEITEDMITSPEPQSRFNDWQAFKGELTFPFNIYRDDENVETGALSVLYLTEGKRAAEYLLSGDQWSVEGNKLTFTLPTAPENGEWVMLLIAEDAIFDICGNGNEEFAAEEVAWKYSLFTPTAADVLGTFDYNVTLNSNGKSYNLGTFTISEYTGEDAEEGDVVIRNLYLDNSEIFGFYDLAAAKLYIQRYQYLGSYEEEGETYGVLTYSTAGEKYTVFDITEEGLVSTDFALAYTDAAVENLLGYEVPAGTTVFTKAAAAEARKAAAFGHSVGKKYAGVKSPKGTPRKIKQIRK